MKRIISLLLFILVITLSTAALASSPSATINPMGSSWKEGEDGASGGVTVNSYLDIGDWEYGELKVVDSLFAYDSRHAHDKFWEEKPAQPGRRHSVRYQTDTLPRYQMVYASAKRTVTTVTDTFPFIEITTQRTKDAITAGPYYVNSMTPRKTTAVPPNATHWSDPRWESYYWAWRGNIGYGTDSDGWRGLFYELETPTPVCDICPAEPNNMYCVYHAGIEHNRLKQLKYWQDRLQENYPYGYAHGNFNVTIMFGMNQFRQDTYRDKTSYGRPSNLWLVDNNRRHGKPQIPEYSYYSWVKQDSKPSISEAANITSGSMHHPDYSPDRRTVSLPTEPGTYWLLVRAVGVNGKEHHSVFGPYQRSIPRPNITFIPGGSDWRESLSVRIDYNVSVGSLNNLWYKMKSSSVDSVDDKETENVSGSGTSAHTTVTLPEGKWQLEAGATNTSGGHSVSATANSSTYLIDKSAPTIDVNPEDREKEIKGTYAQRVIDPIEVRMAINDWLKDFGTRIYGSGVAHYRYKWTNEPDWEPEDSSWTETVPMNKHPSRVSKTLTQDTQGVWYLYVQATDAVGNTSKVVRKGPYYYLKIGNGDLTFDGILDRRIRLVE